MELIFALCFFTPIVILMSYLSRVKNVKWVSFVEYMSIFFGVYFAFEFGGMVWVLIMAVWLIAVTIFCMKVLFPSPPIA